MQYVTFAGDFMRQKSVDIIRPIEAVLVNIGEDTTTIMKRYVRSPFVSRAARGELEGSITWRTANNHGEIENSDDLIEAPPPHCVDIGSANDHAIYVDQGSGPHVNPDGSDEFISEIKEWVKRMGWDEDAAYGVIKNIRERGTDAIPFIKPTYDKLEGIARRRCRNAMATYWRHMRKV